MEATGAAWLGADLRLEIGGILCIRAYQCWRTVEPNRKEEKVSIGHLRRAFRCSLHTATRLFNKGCCYVTSTASVADSAQDICVALEWRRM